MKWRDIMKQYPNRLVLVEALKTSSHNRFRTIEDMAVIQEYTNSKAAWEGYKAHHRENPESELYIFHTSKEDVETIKEIFLGVKQR
jgi:hypothetical protein